jgi:drug/metabolite transporter (DMT)-like permease
MTSPLRGPYRGLFLALLAAASFGTSGSFATPLMQAGWSPTAVVAARISLAALVLAVPAWLAIRGRTYLLRRNVGSLVMYGLLPVAGCQVFYFQAVQRLSVGVALMLEYIGVVLLVGWQWARHGVVPRRLTVAGSVLAMVGLGVVLDVLGDQHLDLVGVFWGVLAAVSLAIYFVLSAKSDPELPAIAMSGVSMGVGAVVLGLIGAVGLVPMDASTSDITLAGAQMSWIWPVVGIAVIAAAFAYVVSIAGARALGAKLSGFVGLTEVLFAVLFAWLLLSEQPSWNQAVGGVLIVAGVALVKADEFRRQVPSQSASAERPVATVPGPVPD